jgi:hypothetical protein
MPPAEDTQPCLPPVIELDPAELHCVGGGLVTHEDYAARSLERPLPAKTDAVFAPGIADSAKG